MKKRIIFVDDETRVLAGLRRLFYAMREEWDMFFASSGEEALRMIEQEKEPIDAIISDMRMPDTDGAELLAIVKEKYPRMIRFILSGFSDREMILKTIGSADQFLSKPCDPNLLKETLDKAFAAQKLVDKNRICKVVGRLRTLPTLPQLYVKLREIVDLPNSSFKQIADVVSCDVTVTAKILQLVNSAFFGLRHRIDNIQQAVTYLGIETLKAIVLTTDVFSKFSQHDIERFGINELYRHSICVGVISSRIGESLAQDKAFIDEVSTVGILHDIGKIVFIQNNPNEYEAILKESGSNNSLLIELEEKELGLNHAELGGYLMGLWGLPDSIVKGISYHHSPEKGISNALNSTVAVWLANMLDNMVAVGAAASVEEADSNAVIETRQCEEILRRSSINEHVVSSLDLQGHLGKWLAMVREIKIKTKGQM